ncbi:zinc finger protein 585B-like isoform X3 [Vanessa cardui]|uniref:zinc finger protein 585B-like isoform X3 n=1 Tax=Vanessa cardui TaxID=171605 RepID=UPI001F134352|nr:zinc finger protein 585B-like isoform X3 [Vanessa cardui]
MTSQLFQSSNMIYETAPKSYLSPSLNAMDDLSNICRICGVINVSLIPLFGEDAQKNELVQKINKYLPITVCEQDSYPLGICQNCASTVLNWHELAQCCIKTEKELTSKLKASTQPDKCSGHQNNVQAGSSSAATHGEARERLSAPCLILIIKEVLNNVYFKIMNMDEENSDLMYVCQMCPDKAASTSVHSLCEHLIANHKELNDMTSVEAFIKENITFEEVLANDAVIDDELEDQVAEIPNYFCPFCESAFSSPTRLVCHLNRHIEVSIDDGVLCCDRLYADKKSFVTHLQEKHVNRSTEGALICKTCGLIEKDHDALAAHVIERHADVEERKKKTEPNLRCQKFIPAVCPECNKSFSNKYNMLTHMKTHTSELSTSKFMCIKCNKTYKSRGSLTYHQRVVHEGVLPFLCSMCGEAFPSRTARDTHARIHTGAKPFTCDYCNKSYRAQNTLSRHIDMHLNIRNYECHLCPKKFRKRTHLDYHLKTHERKK